MGIPKFFRYIAQRWPLASQQVNGNVIPEFDNLYLDMNSIIHMSTHANAENVGHLDDDQVFQAVSNYIEHLFSVIGPQKYFVMAIDGVAPRAKMNQQRARRFRSALDAEKARQHAAQQGVELDEDPFDSNCITPGTEFMARLTTHLKYFIARKITEDSKWQNCRIVLSGHEVPGEGEHKIMQFIRNLRSQPDYDPNTRHCLYGLDADLIMLGLSTHEPHFSLLREEVTFGRKIQFQSQELSEQKFILLHLSVVREYIQLEMTNGEFKQPPDFERLLDDVILILFFIGNDFLPELPMLLVNDGAIPVIFDTYKSYLYSSNNHYISTNGQIDFLALKNWMEYLKSYQTRKFEQQSAIDGWFNSQMDSVQNERGQSEEQIVLTAKQRDVFDYIKKFMRKCISKNDTSSELEISEEPKFVKLLAKQTGFTYDDGKLQYTGNEGDVEPPTALRVLRIYAVAHINDPKAKEDYGQKFTEWKNRYYRHKFKDTYDSEIVRQTSLRYLEGLQWVLFYYYRSCPSWSWYYDNHYSTMTTELISAIGDGFVPEFDLGEPFRPFEQLMSVLPDRSINLIPPALHHLVLEPTSPIIDFYPHTFQLDKNGKKADWEAVVLIPFIDEKRLLKYVRPIEDNDLSEAERFRNSRGIDLEFYFDPNNVHLYKSPSRTLPDIQACTCVSKAMQFPKHPLRYGLLPGSRQGKSALAGFPSLYTLPFNWKLDRDAGVKIFEMPSRDDSVIIEIKPAQNRIRVGQKVYVNWPFLSEAKITSIKSPEPNALWQKVAPRIIGDYKRVGVALGKTEAMVGVRELQGLQRTDDGSFVKDFGGKEQFVPAQMVVTHVEHHDPRFEERKALPLSEEFPIGSHVLVLLSKFYGFPATIKEYIGSKDLVVEVVQPRSRDPIIGSSKAVVEQERRGMRWYTTEGTAKIVNLDIKQLLNLTARVMVEAEGGKKVNIALTFRVPFLNLMAEGFSSTDYYNRWFFSQPAVDLLKQYLKSFRPVLTKLMASRNPVIDSATANSIREWQKANFGAPVYMPTSTEHLTHYSTRAIESNLMSLGPIHLEKVIIKGVEKGALLASDSAHHQLRTQRFQLGDRVVSSLDHGKVPLFTRGVVVGVNGGTASNTTLDIVWDFEFAAGSTLDGRLTTKRGVTVPAQSVLNVSNPQLEYLSGRAPVVTRISAKVDTEATLVRKLQEKENTKKYVPAPSPQGAWKSKETKPEKEPRIPKDSASKQADGKAKKANGKNKRKPKTSEPKPAESQTSELKPAEPKPAEPKPTEPKSTEPKSSEPKSSEPKPTESKSSEPKSSEPRPTEPKVSEAKPSEPKSSNPKSKSSKSKPRSGKSKKARSGSPVDSSTAKSNGAIPEKFTPGESSASTAASSKEPAHSSLSDAEAAAQISKLIIQPTRKNTSEHAKRLLAAVHQATYHPQE